MTGKLDKEATVVEKSRTRVLPALGNLGGGEESLDLVANVADVPAAAAF